MHDAVIDNKQAAARCYGISWRAVNNMCIRLATEALGQVDLLEGVVAVGDRRGQVQEGPPLPDRGRRSRNRPGELGSEGAAPRPPPARSSMNCDRASQLEFVTADGATWITDVVAERAPDATVCLPATSPAEARLAARLVEAAEALEQQASAT